jgi:hypothetical protein
VRGCMKRLSAIEGAAAVLRSEEGGIPSAAAPGALGSLPLPERARPAYWPDAILECGAATRHLQAVAAFASGNLPWAQAAAAAPAPGLGWTPGGGGGAPEARRWQCPGLFAAPGGQGAVPPPGGQLFGQRELGPALFVSWGVWCMLVLLVWCQVRIKLQGGERWGYTRTAVGACGGDGAAKACMVASRMSRRLRPRSITQLKLQNPGLSCKASPHSNPQSGQPLVLCRPRGSCHSFSSPPPSLVSGRGAAGAARCLRPHTQPPAGAAG